MRTVIIWACALALTVLIKLFFVDRFFPDPPVNMVVWIPILIVLAMIAGVVIVGFGLITGQHRRRD